MVVPGFIIVVLILTNYCISSYARNYISTQRQEIARKRESEEQASVSQVHVCTRDGKSLSKQEGSSIYVVPTDMERIYICGSLDISIPDLITIYLSQNGEVFTSKGAVLKNGPFIVEVVSTDALKGGIYRADMYIVRDKIAASVYFTLVK